MKWTLWGARIAGTLGALAIAAPLFFGTSAQAAGPFNDLAFKSVWERTDKAVADGLTSRSWMWGPQTVPSSPPIEPYAETPGGFRQVQYFDKARMEINDPTGDGSQLWYVTNGLLVREMVSGKVQKGENAFSVQAPSEEAVAGDPAIANPDSPTYASFAALASLDNDHPAAPKSGQIVLDFIDKDGLVQTTANPAASPDAGVTYAYFEPTLRHNIPSVFWDFMHQKGLVYESDAWSSATVVDWTFAMGLPITEPYWTKARVGGIEKDVLVQLFERRVLTYTPWNPEGFKVEMGNVGLHYFHWRYSDEVVVADQDQDQNQDQDQDQDQNQDPDQDQNHDQPPSVEQRIAFCSTRAGGSQVFTMKTTGGDVQQLTDQGNNHWPSWSPDNSRIVFQSDRDGNWEIYAMDADGSHQQRLTFDASSVDVSPSWSPDGARIIWSRGGDIYTMASNGGDVEQVTSGDPMEYFPIYSPAGDAYVLSLKGVDDAEVYSASLDGESLTRLTYRDEAQDVPVDWQGSKILWLTGHGGTSELWSMDADGGSQTKLAGDHVLRATYSPDGEKIVFQQNGEVYLMNADGGAAVNITNAAGLDAEPDWSN
jgi:hypothetical protein